jgi:hypothetical protein
MNPDLEDLGALSTATLAAAELEAAQPTAAAAVQVAEPGPEPAHALACANCGSALSGAYCQACGQAAHVHSSLWHLVEETLHGVLHFDTKAWRTLPLLVAQPGVLTRRYIDGQRVRHVSPLALFLFTMFLMFFALGFIHIEPQTVVGSLNGDPVAERAAQYKAVAQARQALAQATAKLAQAQRAGTDEAPARGDVVEAQAELAMAQAELKADAAIPAGAASGAAPLPSDWRAMLAVIEVNTGDPKLDQMLRGPLHNPDLYLYKLKGTAYKFSFMLIPISLPFLGLLFLGRPGATMFGHAVFSLYSLSFMALLFVLLTLLSLAGMGTLAAWLGGVAVPLHMLVHTRQAYALGAWGAVWRVLALLVVAGSTFLVFMLGVMLLAAR